MSVTIFRLNDDKNSLDKFNRPKVKRNPWDLADLSEYLYYCCPECEFKSRQDFLLRHHMKENHENAIVKRRKLSPQELIKRFLDDDVEIEANSDELKLSDRLDVIKNPLLKLPVKNYHEQQSRFCLPEQEKTKSQKSSVSIIPPKVQNFTDLDCYLTESQNLDFENQSDQNIPQNSLFHALEDAFGK